MRKQKTVLLSAAVLTLATSFALAACDSSGGSGPAKTGTPSETATSASPSASAGSDNARAATTDDAQKVAFCSSFDEISENADWQNVGTRDLAKGKADLDGTLGKAKAVVPPDEIAAEWNDVVRMLGYLDDGLGTALAGGNDSYADLEAVIPEINEKAFIDKQNKIWAFGADYCGVGSM